MVAENLQKFDDKWSDESPDYPKCASCGKQIGSAEADEQSDETYDPEIALRIWRKKDGKTQELCFHHECAEKERVL